MPRAALSSVVVLLLSTGSVWPQGEPLGPEFRVNTYTTGHQAWPALSADAAGNFIVVWTGGADGLFGQRYSSSGTPLGAEFQVNTYVTSAKYTPDVASDADGNFVVVWNSKGQDGSSFGIFGQRFAGSGAPLGPEFRVNTYTTGDQSGPHVASDPAGNFVVVWTSTGQYEPLLDVYGQRYASGGAPLGGEFRVNTDSAGCQYVTGVAADGAGNFIVAWQDELPPSGGPQCSGTGVIGRRYAANGGPLGPEFRVNTYSTFDQGGASVAADAAGNFVFVWTSDQDPLEDPFFGIFGQRYDASGLPVGGEFHVNTYTTLYQSVPDVALDGSGNFVVVWNSSNGDGSGYGIFGQRYTGSGIPQGAEFRVNTYIPNWQFRPSLAAEPGGNFVVTWQSDMQDGSGLGIFGQRFGAIVPVGLTRFTVE